jgi:hypothetical protein
MLASDTAGGMMVVTHEVETLDEYLYLKAWTRYSHAFDQRLALANDLGGMAHVTSNASSEGQGSCSCHLH